ncbi:MAG: sulfurtransferase-like selenium metabolism protein YedF [Deltaproteobacteria bacterium]|nr:sulfurtransferase-like selenium metabolism protein YedF [Deltaproteobacteria bacterium]
MSKRRIDMRGRPSPEPVTATIRALHEDPGLMELTVICDNAGQAENVRRAATRLNTDAKVVQPNPTDYHVAITREAEDGEGAAASRRAPQLHVAVLLTSERFSGGDEELGASLMRSFIASLGSGAPKISWLLLFHSAVRLACEGSALLDDIRVLAGQGVEIYAEDTSLKHHALDGALHVGKPISMSEAVSILAAADNVIRP